MNVVSVVLQEKYPILADSISCLLIAEGQEGTIEHSYMIYGHQSKKRLDLEPGTQNLGLRNLGPELKLGF